MIQLSWLSTGYFYTPPWVSALKTKARLLCFRPMKVPKVVREWYRKVGAKGGKVRSAAKTEAVRANGKLGGRPKGSKNKKAKP
jgi:hypothetical protein